MKFYCITITLLAVVLQILLGVANKSIKDQDDYIQTLGLAFDYMEEASVEYSDGYDRLRKHVADINAEVRDTLDNAICFPNACFLKVG